MDLQELQAEGQAKSSAVATCRTHLAEVHTAITTQQQALADLDPEYTRHAETLASLEQGFAATSQRLETLYGKQGRGQQFTSEKNRNVFLKDQVKALKAQLITKQTLLQRLSSEVQSEEKSLHQEEDKQKAGEQVTREHNGQLEKLTGRAKTLLEKRNTAQEVRKTAWRELENVQEGLQGVQAELDKNQAALHTALPR